MLSKNTCVLSAKFTENVKSNSSYSEIVPSDWYIMTYDIIGLLILKY